ncbi:MAG: hypothetical protein R3F07_03725 [Opitutaceae bacterium]
MGQTIVFALLTLWVSTLSFAQGSEDPLDSWVWRNPLPTGGILWKSVYANDLFMTVGSAGEIMATPDGQSWTYLISGTNETLNSVTYGNGVYVAVGEAGTIVTSANGIDWTVRTSGTTERLFGVTYGNDRFIVVGFNGTILSSANGTTWQAETSGSTSRLGGVLFAGNQFVAVGGVPNSSATVLTSPDGTTWTTRTTPVSQFLTGAAHDGTNYVAVGEAGTIISSSDAVTWTARASLTFEALESVTFANSQFVVVGFGGTILTSPDGILWTPRTGDGILLSVEYGNGRYLAIGFSIVLSSTDGISWTELSDGTTAVLNSLTAGNEMYVAVGEDGTLLSSVSGLLWAEHDSTTTEDLYEAASGNGTYVATGASGVIIQSTDAMTWAAATNPAPIPNAIDALTYASNQYVAVDSTGAVMTSPDGLSWTASGNVGFIQPRAITYGNSAYVVAGASGNMRYSTNGTTWSPVTSGTTRTILDVTHGLAGFVAVGQQGIALRSQNGLSWTVVNTGVLTDLNGVSYGPEGYVASGIGGVVLTSDDGLVWTRRYSRTSNALNASLYSNGLYLVAGRQGAILAVQVDPGKPLVNLSTRGYTATATNRMIAGFVLTEGTSPTKTVLIRAAGPALADLGIPSGFLADPSLELKNASGSTIGTNDNWGDFADQTALADASTAVGAFAFAPGSSDAAYLASLPSGKYTAIASGVGGTTGVAIVEVYDVSQGLDEPRMVNISTRLFVGTGQELAIPGFVIEGERPKAVLVRAVGPTLGSIINDTDIVLQDPKLRLVDKDNVEVIANEDWGDYPEQAALQSASTAVGAFPLNAGSKDAAVLVILDPGIYTIKISGSDGGTGLALVEVYEVQ